MNFNQTLPEIIKHLEPIGEIEVIGVSKDISTGQEYFYYHISGKRKVSDFQTMIILSGLQEEYLSEYPIIKDMSMDDEILKVKLTTSSKDKCCGRCIEGIDECTL